MQMSLPTLLRGIATLALQASDMNSTIIEMSNVEVVDKRLQRKKGVHSHVLAQS